MPESLEMGVLVFPASRQVAVFSSSVVVMMTWSSPLKLVRFEEARVHVPV